MSRRLQHYELVEPLGDGTLGVVWRAWDTRLLRYVALRVIAVRPEVRGRAQEVLTRDALGAAGVDHAGVVRVHAAGAVDTDDLVYIDAQLVADPAPTAADPQAVALGRSLASLARAGTIDLRRAVEVIRDAGRGLAAAHALGVVHGSVRAEDVMVTPAGRAMVTDFGLERVRHLMAGQDDGARPEPAATPLADVAAIGRALEAALGMLRDGTIPATLRRVLDRATAPDGSRRYQSAEAFVADLDAFLGHRPTSVSPRSWWRDGLLAFRRNPLKTTAVTSVLLVAVLGTATSANRLGAQRDRAASVLRQYAWMRDLAQVRDLEHRERHLWPRREAQVETMCSWLSEARALHDDLPVYREAVAGLRAAADATGSSLEFVSDADAWRHQVLSQLVHELDGFDVLIAAIEERIRFARGIRRFSTEDVRALWDVCRADVASRRSYRGLAVAPQVGLIPLGVDRSSGLWEFWHVGSGARPERDGELLAGSVRPSADSGLVLVLLPGGRYWKGMQTDDPNGPNHVPTGGDLVLELATDLVDVEVAPFLLSKFEMTQAQWERIAGGNPSHFHTGWFSEQIGGEPVSPLHPIEFVSARLAVEMMFRLELRLPTDDEWEFASRAGTETLWWTGPDRESAWHAGNLADESFRRTGHWKWKKARTHDDGYPLHAPIGRFAANAFGLHDTIGNVEELCLDRVIDPALWLDDDDESIPGALARIRGGSFVTDPIGAVSPNSMQVPVDIRTDHWGLRPARGLDR